MEFHKKGTIVLHKTKRDFFHFICSFIIFLHSTVHGHGFAYKTPVKLANGSYQSLGTVCHRALHDTVSLASYDTHKLCNVNQYVKHAGRSTSNCYLQLRFDAGTNNITCSPTQEFYIPSIHKWVPAYALKPGDALLSKNDIAKILVYIEFIEKPLKTYTVEVQGTHTFFVGQDSILTHNMVLPIAFTVGFSLPFGSAVAGTAGTFFGPVGVIGGVVVGGIISIAVKIACENRVPRYKKSVHDIAAIKTYRHNIMQHNEEVNAKVKIDGCFTPTGEINIVNIHVTPIENPLLQKPTGCIEIEINSENIAKGCFEHKETEKINDDGCFQPVEQDDQILFNTQDKAPATEKQNSGNKPLIVRNWKEFEDTPMGREHGKKFIHTGKCNPKDGSPIRKLIADIPDAEMFKKDHLFAIDRLHDDHFEVWNKRGKWIGVANLDGSKNHKKTNAVTDTSNRDLPR